MYSPDKPLSCGAKVWIETDAEVITIPDIPFRKKEKRMKLRQQQITRMETILNSIEEKLEQVEEEYLLQFKRAYYDLI